MLPGLAAGCATAHTPATAPPPTTVATPAAPTHRAPDDGPLADAVSSIALRTDLLRDALATLPREGSAVAVMARDLLFYDLRGDERFTRARLDLTRPLRSWFGPIDAPVLARLEQLRELGRAQPEPAADAAASTAPSPDAARWRALNTACPVGGFAQRIVWPSLDPAVTARVIDESLDAARWQRLPSVDGFDALRRWSRVPTALGISHTRDAVVVDVWFEPLEGCQSDEDRAAFSVRAVERLAGLRAGEAAAQALPDDALYAMRGVSLDEARRAFAVGVTALYMAAMPRAPGEASTIDPEAIPGLMLGGLREADSALRLVGDGGYTNAVSLALRRAQGGTTFVLEAEVGRDAQAFPAEDLWRDEPTVSVAGARDVLDVRTDWLAGFGPVRSPETWTRLRQQAGYQGGALAPLHDLAHSLRRTLRAARPEGAPWPAAERVDREIVATMPAAAAGAGDRLHIALLSAGTASPAAACALASAPAACAPVRLAVGATRGVPGGFARLLAVGPRFAVVVGASRAAVAAASLRDAAAAAPCAGTVPEEHLGADLRAFVLGPAEVDIARQGTRITARLRRVEQTPTPPR